MTTLAEIKEITVREHQLRVPHADASAALDRVMNEPAIRARARLRFGPGRTCEQIARMLDKAIVQAERDGFEPDLLVMSAGSAAAAEDIVRVRRKAHGVADWISSPTSDVTIVLRPAGYVAPEAITDAAPQPSETPLAAEGPTHTPETAAELAVRDALYAVLDPDLGVNIVDLGFVRRIKLDEHGVATITMTLTSPACPLVSVMVGQMRTVLSAINTEFAVEWEWVPSWRPSEISPNGRDELMAIGFNAF